MGLPCSCTGVLRWASSGSGDSNSQPWWSAELERRRQERTTPRSSPCRAQLHELSAQKVKPAPSFPAEEQQRQPQQQQQQQTRGTSDGTSGSSRGMVRIQRVADQARPLLLLPGALWPLVHIVLRGMVAGLHGEDCHCQWHGF